MKLLRYLIVLHLCMKSAVADPGSCHISPQTLGMVFLFSMCVPYDYLPKALPSTQL